MLSSGKTWFFYKSLNTKTRHAKYAVIKTEHLREKGYSDFEHSYFFINCKTAQVLSFLSMHKGTVFHVKTITLR